MALLPPAEGNLRASHDVVAPPQGPSSTAHAQGPWPGSGGVQDLLRLELPRGHALLLNLGQFTQASQQMEPRLAVSGSSSSRPVTPKEERVHVDENQRRGAAVRIQCMARRVRACRIVGAHRTARQLEQQQMDRDQADVLGHVLGEIISQSILHDVVQVFQERYIEECKKQQREDSEVSDPVSEEIVVEIFTEVLESVVDSMTRPTALAVLPECASQYFKTMVQNDDLSRATQALLADVVDEETRVVVQQELVVFGKELFNAAQASLLWGRMSNEVIRDLTREAVREAIDQMLMGILERGVSRQVFNALLDAESVICAT